MGTQKWRKSDKHRGCRTHRAAKSDTAKNSTRAWKRRRTESSKPWKWRKQQNLKNGCSCRSRSKKPALRQNTRTRQKKEGGEWSAEENRARIKARGIPRRLKSGGFGVSRGSKGMRGHGRKRSRGDMRRSRGKGKGRRRTNNAVSRNTP